MRATDAKERSWRILKIMGDAQKGQGAIEALVLSVVALSILGLLFVYLSSDSTTTEKTHDALTARQSFDELEGEGRAIFQEGVGSKRTIAIYLPRDIERLEFSNKRISFVYFSGQNTTRATTYPVFGSVAVTPGMNYVPATSVSKGVCFGNISACAQCGDSIVEGGEQCDGQNVNASMCRTMGYDRGNLSCTATCLFNTSACIAPVCGNNLKELGEECDGQDLAGLTCNLVPPYWSGPLTCTSCHLNTSLCNLAQSYCMNIDVGSASWDGGNKKLHDVTIFNTCNKTIYVNGANITWSGVSEALLQEVQLNGATGWVWNCGTACTPTGKQASGTAVYFNSNPLFSIPLTPNGNYKFDKIEWDKTMTGTSVTIHFILNDTSQNASISFTP